MIISRMSRTAIATWQGFVATTLDFARALVLVDVVDGQVAARKEVKLAAASAQAMAQRLEKVGAHEVICGAISAPLLSAVEARGIRVIPFVRGGVEEVIRGCLEGTLEDERFHMAGCRPCKYGSARCRRRSTGPQSS
jgi:predicted Fe-Mo cluster-binding NifX family protein